MAKHLLLPVLTLSFFLSPSGLAQVINTTVPPLSGWHTDIGITFNLQVQDSIVLNKIGISFVNGTSSNYFIWKKNGPISGPPDITFLNGWTPLQLGFYAPSNPGIGNLDYIPLTNPDTLAPGTYGFYVGGGPFHISDTSNGPPFQYPDGTTTIITGSGVGYSGAQPNPATTVRQFNGALEYFPLIQSCPKPSGMSSSRLGGYVYEIDWDENGTATQWELEWGETGFIPGTGTKVLTSAKPSQVSGFVTGNQYDIYIRSICTVGDTSLIEGPYLLETTYCQTQPMTSSGSEISNVVLAGEYLTISNPTTCPAPATTQDFTSTQLADGKRGNNYSVQAIFSTCYQPEFGSGQAWIDWNQDMQFDTTELLGTWTGVSETTNSTTFNGVFQFQVPQNAKLGPTRLRVIQAQGIGTAFPDCILIFSGSVEDYTFVVLDSNQSCAIPTLLHDTNITPTTAELSWTENSGSTAWEILYGPIGFGPGQGTSVLANANPFTLTGLSSDTEYDYYVRSICGPGDTSYYSLPDSFYTPCGRYPTPYYENFDNTPWIADDISNISYESEIERCWYRFPNTFSFGFNWRVRSDSAFTSGTGPATDFSGTGNYIYTESFYSSSGYIAELKTPVFDVAHLNNPTVEFQYFFRGPQIDRMVIEGDTGSGFAPVDSIVGEQQVSIQDKWIKKRIIFPPSNTLQIRFLGIRGADTICEMAIDEFVVREMPSCIEPVDLERVYALDDEIRLSWSDSGSAVLWSVEYGAPGFNPGTGFSAIVNNPSHTAQNLVPNSSYQFYIRSICNPGDTSEYGIPLTIHTSCTPIMAPWNDDLNGSSWIADPIGNATNSRIDSCWYGFPNLSHQYGWRVRENPSQTGNTGPISDFSGMGNYVYTESSLGQSGDRAVLETPTLDLNGFNYPKLEFWYHFFGQDIDRMYVEMLVNNVWTKLDSILGQQQASSTSLWKIRTVDLPVANVTRIRFVGVRGTGEKADMAIDKVHVYEGSSCPMPLSVKVDDVFGDSAQLSWIDSNASSWHLEYGSTGFQIGSGIQLLTINPFVTLKSLNPGQEYEVYIRSVCSPGVTSIRYGPVVFNSSCIPFSVPWFDHVESGGWFPDDIGNATQSIIDHCWRREEDRAGAYTWYVRSAPTATDYSGPDSDVSQRGNFVFVESSLAGDSAILYTPAVDISATTNPTMEFSYYFYGAGINKMLIEERGANGWILLDSIAGEQQNGNSEPWLIKKVNLSPTSSAQVRFIAIKGTSDEGDIALDEIAIYEQTTCIRPTQLIGTPVGYSEIELSWIENGMASQWEIEYGIVGYSPGSGQRMIVNSNPAIIDGLTFYNSYDFYVRSICNTGDTSFWSRLHTTDLNYCQGGPTNGNSIEITNVELIGETYDISNLQTCPGALGVQNFTQTDSADVEISNTYWLKITFGTCAGTAVSAGEAWIDWNQNGFFDSMESLGTWFQYPELPGSTTFNAVFQFSPPPSTTPGTTQLRIAMELTGSHPLDPCASFPEGSVEDYKIVVNPPEFYLGADTTIGKCDSMPLSAGAFDSYLWSTGDTTASIIIDGSSLSSGDYDYSVTVTDASGTLFSDKIKISIASAPNVSLSASDTIFVSGVSSYTLEAGSGFTNYIWDDGSSFPNRIVTEDGTYWVTVWDEFACTASDTVVVDLLLSTEIVNQGKIQVFPNPAQDYLNVRFSNVQYALPEKLEIFSVSGQMVFQIQVNSSFTQIDLRDFTTGIYELRFWWGNEQFRKKLIISK
ncbi:MAG TPA: hypothetical protein DDX92_07650 [Flavobacteriales bacterium]|jgi:hypothetical protein|nr:hypothetical protein [Flavobacteriales bacterium]